MSLRWRIQLLVTSLLVAFAAAFAAQQIMNARASVREEIEGASRVAAQLLAGVSTGFGQAGPIAMQTFLTRLGRVRANELTLFDAADRELYRSPPPTYKTGRAAPDWYAALVTPRIDPREIVLPAGRLVIQPDASRAVLDGWDDLTGVMWTALLLFVLANVGMFPLTARALRPLEQVVDGLNAMERGHYGVRLPPLPAREMDRIGQSFNRMAAAVAETDQAREAEARARADLAENRALTGIIQRRIERERGTIARELHDELGQQITAIKTLGLSIAQRSHATDAQSEKAARLVMATADQIYDVMHQIVARLRPLALDRFGLADALEDMASDWRAQHRAIQFETRIGNVPDNLPEPVATAAYRIVQEAVTNALRHAAATVVRVEIDLTTGDASNGEVEGADRCQLGNSSLAATGPCLRVLVVDNGRGLPKEWERAGHFGVLGMRERAELLGGSLDVASPVGGGVQVRALLPIRSIAGADDLLESE